MENEDVIRSQMEETRTSLTDKLETLEKQVVDTVQGATSAVTDTVEAVKDSVQGTVASFKDSVTTVKDSVQDTVSAVKDSMQGGVDAVKDMFDLPAHVERYPWMVMGGSVVVGYCLGSLLSGKKTPEMAQLSSFAETGNVARSQQGHNGGHRGSGREKRKAEPARSAVTGLLDNLGPEISKLKGLALGALMGTVREMIVQAIPEHLGNQLKDVINNITEKVGGQPIQGSDWTPFAKKEPAHENQPQGPESGGQAGMHRQRAMGGFDRE